MQSEQYVLLRFYVHESHRLNGKPLWEWLLESARKMGIMGGSAFRAMAGFGAHGVLHEDRFFELQGSLTVEIEFLATESESHTLIEKVSSQKVRAIYTMIPASFGVIGADA
jgi:PII-like signaling protein